MTTSRAVSVPGVPLEYPDFELVIEAAHAYNPQDVYAVRNKHTGSIEWRGMQLPLSVLIMQSLQTQTNKVRSGEMNGYENAALTAQGQG